MQGQVVGDDHITGLKVWCKLGFDIDLEGSTVHPLPGNGAAQDASLAGGNVATRTAQRVPFSGGALGLFFFA